MTRTGSSFRSKKIQPLVNANSSLASPSPKQFNMKGRTSFNINHLQDKSLYSKSKSKDHLGYKSGSNGDTGLLSPHFKRMCTKKIADFLDHASVQFLMFVVTVYALLGDDLRLALAPKAYDDLFTLLTTISLILFVIELILASIGYDDYLFSFFFWLDLVSSLSLVTDIEPIMSWLFGSSYDDGTNNDEEESAGDAGSASLARASRGARIGTKAGRISRVVRLIRLIRIIKLFKVANKQIEKQEQQKGKQDELELKQQLSKQLKSDEE